MNLIEAKCQHCVFTATAEYSAELLQKYLKAEGGKEALAEIKGTAAVRALRGRFNEVTVNGITLEALHVHLVAQPTHALTLTIRNIEL